MHANPHSSTVGFPENEGQVRQKMAEADEIFKDIRARYNIALKRGPKQFGAN